MLDAMILSPRQREELDKATAYYADQMVPEAAQYLMARGISKEAAIGSRLGYCSDPLPGHENMVGRISIPYLAGGHTVSLKFRVVGDAPGARYLGLPAQHPRLYGVDALREPNPVVCIVEGELDAIVMTHMVGVPAVAVPGASTWLPHMPRCFTDVEQVLIVTDNDASNESNPGQALAKKIAASIRGSKIIAPPKDCDVTEWFLRDGAAAIRSRLGLM